MKIMHINNNYLETTLHQTMIEHLEKQGIENYVFASTYDMNVIRITPNENVFVSECYKKIDRIDFYHKQRKIYKSIKQIPNIESYDLIHAHTLFTDGNNAMKLSEKYDIPYIITIRNSDVNSFFKYMIHLRGRGIRIMKNASAIFFLSPMYKEEVFEKYIPKKYWKEFEAKTYIMPNGIDDYWFTNINKAKKISKDKVLNIIYVGRIEPNKNILKSQEALNILRSEGYKIKYTIVGRIQNEKEFKKILADKNTEYLGQLEFEKLIDEYRANDIFVMPSITESFGLVYVEAMSQGLPIIYSKGQGFDGQFEEGEVGYAVNPLSGQDIAEKIICIRDNYLKISQNCIEKSSEFKWDKICEKYKNIIKELNL